MTYRTGSVTSADGTTILIPTLHFDARLAREAEGALATFGAIRAEVMLLGGDRSARPLRVAQVAWRRLVAIDWPHTEQRRTSTQTPSGQWLA
jgi:hypothetical protein